MVFRDKGRDDAPDVYNIIHLVEQFIVPLFNTIGSPALTQRYGEWMAPLSSLYTFARARTKQLFYRNE